MRVTMAPTVVFVHTVPLLIPVFDRLATEMLPGVRTLTIVDEPLLEHVRQRGSIVAEDAERLATHAAEAQAVGAAVVLVTCSSISPAVDLITAPPVPILKIDAEMIAAALRSGSRIGAVATAETTLEPTRRLLMSEAARSGRELEVELVFVPHALPALIAGDGETHDRLVRDAIAELAPRSDVIVLAQASIARVLATMPALMHPVPILSSPHLALGEIQHLLQGETS